MGTPRTWVRVGQAILLTSALAISPLALAPAAAGPLPARTADPGQAAAGWLAAQVEGGELTPSNLADAIIAFAAAGVGADAAATALGQLEAKVDSYIAPGTSQAGALGKVMLAVAVGGGNVNSFGGHDLEADLRGLMAASGDNAGQFGSATVYDQSYAILALATTSGGVPPASGAWLASKQCTEGDYSWDGSCPSWSPDPDSTAIAIQALHAAGETAALADAEAWLLDGLQAPDGSLTSFGTPNSSSTAAAGQAYRVLGHAAEADKAAAWTATLQFGCSADPANVGSIPWAAGGTDFLLMSTPQAILGLGAGRLDTLSIAGATPAAPTLACPPDAPTDVIAIAGAGQATVLWSAPAQDGGSPVLAYLVQSDTAAHTCAPRPVEAGICIVTGLPDGKYRFSVVAISAAGRSPTSDPSSRVTVDTTAPVVKAPVVSLRQGRQLSGVNVPVKVTWSGSDNVSGIDAYTLERSADGGTTYAGVSLASPTATSRSTTLAAGSARHRFHVKATDASGNASAWKAGPPLAVSLVDDASARITYRGAWTTSKPASASGATLHYTKSRGASASITFTGRSIAWVAPKGMTRGKATVYVDGRNVATVNLRAAATGRVLVYAKSWSASGKHTLRIVAKGTAGHPRIDVDAFVIVK